MLHIESRRLDETFCGQPLFVNPEVETADYLEVVETKIAATEPVCERCHDEACRRLAAGYADDEAFEAAQCVGGVRNKDDGE